MKEHTFTKWLHREAAAARCALLSAYEKRDELLYKEGPRLERAYMSAVGEYENQVIREEIECELLRKKQQMIQAALNRREPIDEAALDAQIDKLRQELLAEAMGPTAPGEYRVLPPEEEEELQKLYQEIVKRYHPETHPQITQVQRDLFEKAREAYRRQDLPALKLIYEMLKSTQEEEFALAIQLMIGLQEEERSLEVAVTDYKLAARIYESFRPRGTELVLREEWDRCCQSMETVTKEMERIRLTFPHTAAEMLADPEKLKTYREELDHRMRGAKAERDRRSREIETLMKGVAAHG